MITVEWWCKNCGMPLMVTINSTDELKNLLCEQCEECYKRQIKTRYQKYYER